MKETKKSENKVSLISRNISVHLSGTDNINKLANIASELMDKHRAVEDRPYHG